MTTERRAAVVRRPPVRRTVIATLCVALAIAAVLVRQVVTGTDPALVAAAKPVARPADVRHVVVVRVVHDRRVVPAPATGTPAPATATAPPAPVHVTPAPAAPPAPPVVTSQS